MKIPRFQLAHRGSIKHLVSSCLPLFNVGSVHTLVFLAVGTALVVLQFDQALECGLVLSRPVRAAGGHSSRHDGGKQARLKGEAPIAICGWSVSRY